MANPFDRFDANPFDQFDDVKPRKPSSMPRTGEAMSNPEQAGWDETHRKVFPTLFKEEVMNRQGQPLTGRDVNLAEAASNIPGEVQAFGKGAWQAITNPVDTAKGLGRMTLGIARNLGLNVGTEQDEELADAFGQQIMQRFRSADDFKRSINEAPLQTLADLSLGLYGGQAALKGGQVVTKAAGAGKTADTIGDVATSFGVAANTVEPVNALAKSTAGLASRLIPETLPENLYQSAVKMSTGKKLTPQDRQRLTKFAVAQGIMPTDAGMAKAFDNINELNTKVQSVVDAATDTGRTIPIDDVMRSLDDVRTDVLDTFIDPKAYLVAIDKLEDRIRLAQGRNFTPRQAQNFKSGIYKEIQEMYQPSKGNITSSASAVKKGKVALAKALKNELEKIYPDLKNINATEGEFLKLVDAIEPAVKRIANRDKIGIGVPMKTGAGELVGQSVGIPGVGGFLGFVQGVLDAPLVKSRLAIALEKARSKGVNVPGGRTRTATYQTGEALPQE